MPSTSAARTWPVTATASTEERSGVEAAFDTCSRGLYRYVVVRCGGDTHLADDLMQQTWLQASRSGALVAENEQERWLFGIARNVVRAHWRKQARRPAHVPIADPQLAAEVAERLVAHELPGEIVERKELHDQLLLAITELRSEEQELIIGHYFRDEPQRAIARRLGLSERAVEGRLYRARQALREALRELHP